MGTDYEKSENKSNNPYSPGCRSVDDAPAYAQTKISIVSATGSGGVLAFVQDPANNERVPLESIWASRKQADIYFAVVKDGYTGWSGVYGEVVGVGFIRGFADNWDEKVFGMVVGKNYGHMGIGTLILQTAHVAAKMRGLKHLRLHVDLHNKCALDLYDKFGFVHQGERENGEWIMRKAL